MPLKDILVHMDATPQSVPRLEAAIALADAHQAHLTGLYVIHPPHIPGFVRPQIGDEILERQARLLAETAEAVETKFRDRVGTESFPYEWRTVEGDPVHVLALHARYADLAILGQRNPNGDDISANPDMPDRVVLSVGRPALVVPYAGTFPVVGERVMVAWDASRLATRAVSDAMPVLTQAKHVAVLAINPKGGEDGHGDIPSADICLHLARHGVHVEAQHVYADDVDSGAMLLSRAADEGMDMLVMGAYGHARWREVVLGGVTRHVLKHMTVPVLMSH